MSWIYRLIRSGQPAPDRVEGVTGRVADAVKTQLVEVFGQRKLLKWTVPGIAHFFVFWAFLILATVYLEAYGSLFQEGWAIPVVGRWGVLGFAAGLHRRHGPARHHRVRGHPREELTEAARPRAPGSRARTSAAPG